ncbi:hypothetical protein L1S34_02530 [Flavobacterium sp. K77]|uniref:hypothetical protein n=1 Tax=Flavobacterium sp. K77 TaxID=2910676 RepID=UPI001F381D7C|nr:hypothetical protein [Flavobacterium sp. K77]MCF6140157.1 hypothetical protein [Flavobacterium sp. K77]
MYINSLKTRNSVAVKGWRSSTLLIGLLLFLSSNIVSAQCAMCRAALTSDDNTTQAAAVNDGIVYLMIIPYLLVAVIGFMIYKMKKKKA